MPSRMLVWESFARCLAPPHGYLFCVGRGSAGGCLADRSTLSMLVRMSERLALLLWTGKGFSRGFLFFSDFAGRRHSLRASPGHREVVPREGAHCLLHGCRLVYPPWPVWTHAGCHHEQGAPLPYPVAPRGGVAQECPFSLIPVVGVTKPIPLTFRSVGM